MRKITVFLAILACLPAAHRALAQEENKVDYTPAIHGTIRAKYEYQNRNQEGRFEVRNARFSLEGNVAPIVAYKAEIDLSAKFRQPDVNGRGSIFSAPLCKGSCQRS